MARREARQKIARDEIVALRLGMDGRPFENVFGDQDVALFGEVGGIIRIVLKRPIGGGSAVEQAMRGGMGAQGL
jgi:hypothetical protein